MRPTGAEKQCHVAIPKFEQLATASQATRLSLPLAGLLAGSPMSAFCLKSLTMQVSTGVLFSATYEGIAPVSCARLSGGSTPPFSPGHGRWRIPVHLKPSSWAAALSCSRSGPCSAWSSLESEQAMQPGLGPVLLLRREVSNALSLRWCVAGSSGQSREPGKP